MGTQYHKVGDGVSILPEGWMLIFDAIEGDAVRLSLVAFRPVVLELPGWDRPIETYQMLFQIPAGQGFNLNDRNRVVKCRILEIEENRICLDLSAPI